MEFEFTDAWQSVTSWVTIYFNKTPFNIIL